MAPSRFEGLAVVVVIASTAISVATARASADEKDACIAASEEGQRLRADGKLGAARSKFLTCARSECPSLVQGDCSTWLAEIDAALPSIVVVARDASGNDLPAATLSIDAEPPTPIDGKPIHLDPGPHALEVEADGRTAKSDVLVATGEKNRVVVVTLAAPVAPPPPTTTSLAPAPPPNVERHLGAPFWITGAIGVAALGSATIFGLSALSSRNDLRDTCAPRCSDDDVDAVKRKRLITDVSIGVSIVSFGLAAFFFVRGGESDVEGPPVVVSASAHGASIDWSMRF